MPFRNSLMKTSAVTVFALPKIWDWFFSVLSSNGQKQSFAWMAEKAACCHLNTTEPVLSKLDKRPNVKKLSVEGNIAVGKSTLLNILGRMFEGWHMVTEPVKKWQSVQGTNAGNLLEMMYQDPARWSYTFQTFSCMSRLKTQLEPFSEQLIKVQNPVQIFERSVYSDRYVFAKHLFDLGVMSEMEWVIYQDWHSFLLQEFRDRVALDGILYLQASPRQCYDRLSARGRKEEECIQMSYLEGLHDQHEQWLISKSTEVHFENLKDIPILVLDVNEHFIGNSIKEQRIADKIVDFLKTL